ncbi:glycosyltransferase [Gelidibacter japonicus]|uniref:glycosyltransferase n=1 Tax=Gelidibacter japonicus TaxID=1962232 RepID=UPI003A8DF1DF
MKILIVDNSAMNLRGNAYCTNSLNGLFVTDLINCNNKISYFQFAKANDDSISEFDLEENGVTCHPLPIKKRKMINYLNAYLKIIPFITKNDFIYFYYPSSFKYAPFLCWLFRKKFGLYVRGMNGINDKISGCNYKMAFTIFTVSDFFTEMINERTNKKTAHTIKPMIPFSEKDVIIDRDYSLSDKVSILYLGRIAHDKGIGELLKAAKILKDKGYNFELNLVGSGEFLQKSKQLIEEYSIGEVVIVHGAVFEIEAVKSFYVNSDMYILPTYHEGFPRTLYEAMIFGTPIITTFVGGIPALMKDGWNCKEIQPKSTESIVEALEFAFLNYDKMKDYAKNGTNTVCKIVDSKRLSHGQHLDKIIKTL